MPTVGLMNRFAAALRGKPLDYHVEKAAGSVDRPRCFVLERGHGIHDPRPGHRPVVIASRHGLVGPRRAFLERLLAVAFSMRAAARQMSISGITPRKLLTHDL
jgi:hypothetical protein